MTLWLILALMTAAAIFAVVWPLVQSGKVVRSGSDVLVYRDQLDEVERDLAAGSIGKTEAEAARVEISRRLLTAADAAKSGARAFTSCNRVVPADRHYRCGTVADYWGRLSLSSHRLARPGVRGARSPARRTTQSASRNSKIWSPRSKSISKTTPSDGRGWEVLAPVYMQLGRYSDAVDAWRSALEVSW